ncbi:amidohydrolase family protein [Psychrosphaera haliotis]|uniref:Amidohydrolase family protein n=1 Tax=Psychrosphaera haliotis TaxID=555083 RepID=A0A6N8F9R7_9GAMM|nr:amidohydrolase family protein [Psychrosphaera haliotis]MUH71261.1 amidohydrolase family protein [Psychrosphaera haliotis]
MDMPSLDVNGPMFSKVTTKAQAKELTKQQISQGTHILKVVWTQETGLSHEQLLEIFKPAISTAKRNGLIVAIHVEKLLGAKWAIKAGADILVHGVLRESIDQDLITMMLSNNVTYMPTLTVYHHYFDFLKNELSFSDIETKNALTSTIKSFDLLNKEKAKADNILQLFNKYLPLVDNSEAEIAMLSEQEQSIIKQLKAVFSERYHLMQELNLNQVVSAGVNVSLGTDAGNIGTLHGSSLYGEIQAWKAAGISNKNIIKAVTLGNALAFNVAESIGSLTSGKNANFVVLDENPYKVLSTLRQPIQVYKHGALVFGGDLK